MPTDVFAFGRDFVNGHRAVRLDRAHVEFRGRSGKLRFGEIGRPRSGKTASRDAGRLSRERKGQQGKRKKEQFCSHSEYHSTNECRVKHLCPAVGCPVASLTAARASLGTPTCWCQVFSR